MFFSLTSFLQLSWIHRSKVKHLCRGVYHIHRKKKKEKRQVAKADPIWMWRNAAVRLRFCEFWRGRWTGKTVRISLLRRDLHLICRSTGGLLLKKVITVDKNISGPRYYSKRFHSRPCSAVCKSDRSEATFDGSPRMRTKERLRPQLSRGHKNSTRLVIKQWLPLKLRPG